MTAPDDPERLGGGEWAVGVVLAFVGAGLVVGSPLLIAAAAVPLAYLFAAFLGTEPPATVRVQRRITVGDGVVADGGGPVGATDGPAGASGPSFGRPGDTLTVRTTVRNAGPNTLVDLRVVDGVPGALSVVDGSNRTCVTLEPGAETTVAYDVELRRGEHEFADPTVRTRDYTGTMARTWTPAVAGDREVHCSRALEEVPLDEGRDEYAGDVPTDEGGRGVEFYAVREYETGDPVGAIDWRRYANTRELATVEYRAERSTRTVCLVDARPSQFRETAPAAVDLSLDATERACRSLVGAGYPTGVVGLHSDQLTAVAPGTDDATRQRLRELLAAMRALEPSEGAGSSTAAGRGTVGRRESPYRPPDPEGSLTDAGSTASSTAGAYPTPEAVEAREQSTDESASPLSDGSFSRTEATDPVAGLPAALPDDALVYFFSSFVDDEPTDVVELLRSHGYTVRVVSPDVTGGEDTAARLAGLARETRLSAVRATGAQAIDWDPDRPLELVLQAAMREGRR